MKREKLNTLNEKDIITGLITSDKYCREIAPIINTRLLEVEYSRVIANWIIDYFNKFKQAPQKDIIKLYRSHVEELRDEALQDNVLSFIENIDKNYDKVKSYNDEYAIQQALEYLNQRALKNLVEDVDSYLVSGDVIKANNAITKYKTVDKSSGDCISILNNRESLINALTQENELLFEFSGAYGKIIGKVHREDFIAFLAPMKRGKTFALIDAGVVAMQNGLKVLFVSCEMSESNMIKRFWTSLSGQLSEDKSDINYPYFEKIDTDDEKCWVIENKIIDRKAVSIQEIEKKQKNMKRMFRGGDIRVLAVPTNSLTVEALDIRIERLVQQENYIPDVIIVDYADILAPSDRTEYRNQLDGIWKRLRGLAQKRKVALFTASQSGRDSIDKDVSSKDIAEDIRKIAHVTSMVSLNQTQTEKKNGILRLKQLAMREGEAEFREAVCTQCLSIGRIVLDSRFDTEVDMSDYEQVGKNKRSRK